MKTIVFGATGKIGSHVTAQLLEAGHEVTAFTRSPDKIDQPHKNLRLIRGDVLDAKAVKEAVSGQGAVFCTLGMPLTNKDGLRAKGIAHIVQAMEDTGVKRLINLSVYGAGDSHDSLTFLYKFLIMPLLLRHVVKDHNAQEDIIINSKLDWTIVRPVNFTEGKRLGKYFHNAPALGSNATYKISQADVADFMIKQLTSDNYLRKSPAISY